MAVDLDPTHEVFGQQQPDSTKELLHPLRLSDGHPSSPPGLRTTTASQALQILASVTAGSLKRLQLDFGLSCGDFTLSTQGGAVMREPSEKCHICNEPVAPRFPVIFDHGVIVHLDCYSGAEEIATLVSNFLETRPGEQFCHACLGRHLHQDQQTVEKAITALRLTRKVVIEPICTICDSTRVTVRLRQEARPT